MNNLEDNHIFAIQPSSLGLTEDFFSTFMNSENKLEMATRLIKENDENLMKFGIRQIRNFTDTLKKNSKIENLIHKDCFDTVIELLLNSKDNSVIFESSWVVINITNYSSYYANYLAMSDRIKDLFELLKSLDKFLLNNHLIWIFCNLLGESVEAHQSVTSKVDLMSFVCEHIRNEDDLPNYFKSNLFWLLGNIIKYQKAEYVEACLNIFPYVFKYLRSNLDKNLFVEALFAVEKLSNNHVKEIFDLFQKYEISLILIQYINTKSDSYELRLIFKILIDLSWTDEYNIKILYEANIFKIFENFLSESLIQQQSRQEYLTKNIFIIKDLIIVISNFASTEIQKVRDVLVRKTKILSYLLEVLKYTSKKEIIVEVLHVLVNSLMTEVSNIKMELLRVEIPEVFCQYLSNDDVEIQALSLKGILNFLLYADEIMEGHNIMKVQLESLGAVTIIDNLQQSKDDEVAKISFNIMTKYFLNN